METRRRITLYDQMSAVDGGGYSSFAGLNLDAAAAMASHKRAAATATTGSRTLLDIIKEEAPNKKDRKSWRSFKNKLRLKRAGSAWFSSSHIAIPNRSNSDSNLTAATSTSRPHSFRRDAAMTFRDCFSDDEDDSDPAREGTRRLSTVISEDRALSERESAAAAAAAGAHDEEEPVRMSLMDLLEENGSMYRERDEEEVCESVKETANREIEEDEEEEDEEEDDEIVEQNKEQGGGRKTSSSIEQKCCVCMVRRKGAAFIPCGHTFCRQCSRELWVTRGHCPLCNNFIVEILDLF